MPQIGKENSKILYPDISYKINGVGFKVHNELGRFLSEKSYADAFEQELKNQGIEYSRETALSKSFPAEANRRNIPDFIVSNKVVVDLKAKRIITRDDYYQMKRYLDASDKELGIIINFQQKYLAPKRILHKK